VGPIISFVFENFFVWGTFSLRFSFLLLRLPLLFQECVENEVGDLSSFFFVTVRGKKNKKKKRTVLFDLVVLVLRQTPPLFEGGHLDFSESHIEAETARYGKYSSVVLLPRFAGTDSKKLVGGEKNLTGRGKEDRFEEVFDYEGGGDGVLLDEILGACFGNCFFRWEKMWEKVEGKKDLLVGDGEGEEGRIFHFDQLISPLGRDPCRTAWVEDRGEIGMVGLRMKNRKRRKDFLQYIQTDQVG